MIDHVLVTVKSGAFHNDMELPVRISVKELSEKLLEIFKGLSPEIFGEKETIDLYFEGIRLNPSKTLEDSYVWDGCILEIK